MPIEAKIICEKCGLEREVIASPCSDFFTIHPPEDWKIVKGMLVCKTCVKEYNNLINTFLKERSLPKSNK